MTLKREYIHKRVVLQVWFQNRRSKERRMKQLRYGPYRPGRRARGARDDPLLNPHLFGPDGLHRDYYPPHLQPPPPGQPPEPYFMLMGAPDQAPSHPGAELGLPPPPNPPFPSIDESHPPPHPPDSASFLLDDPLPPSPDHQHFHPTPHFHPR